MTQAEIKQALYEAIDAADDAGRYTEAQVDRVHALISDLIAHNPMPRPIDEQDKVTGPWGSLFAQFGSKHLADKPIVRETSFNIATFNALPNIPFRNLQIEQEIHHSSGDFNNIGIVETLDGAMPCYLITFGRYRIEEADPQKFLVGFHQVELRSRDGASDDDIRGAYGFDVDQPLIIDFSKPLKFHSSVVYCDDDLRINFGSAGGVFVLDRHFHNGYSVDFK